LIELLWPDTTPESGRHNLSLALSSLRNQLEPPGVPAGTVLIADRFSVELNPETFTTDVSEFEQALRSAGTERDERRRAQRLAEAADRYGGELLPGYYEEWIAPEQGRLAERFCEAVHQWIGLRERAGGDLSPAIEYARRAVRADPLREEAHQDLIRLLLATGQPAAALRQWREMERVLDEELAEEPGRASKQLLRQIEGRRRRTQPRRGPPKSPPLRPFPLRLRHPRCPPGPSPSSSPTSRARRAVGKGGRGVSDRAGTPP
jgi:DNA-binding SARP family transcriptional activator